MKKKMLKERLNFYEHKAFTMTLRVFDFMAERDNLQEQVNSKDEEISDLNKALAHSNRVRDRYQHEVVELNQASRDRDNLSKDNPDEVLRYYLS
jgi:chromosome segregation ATPase